MCGLVALLSLKGAANQDRLRDALTSIAHRGPDGEAIATTQEGRLALGFRRLSILDLSQGADQPMHCPHTGNILIFNGEIYNFLELRAELEALGHGFRTQSDTEVILQAWREWGEQCFARFNGMWAIALYEAHSQQLWLSRDRMGVKPLFFASDGRSLCFASEIRAVLRALGIPAKVNRARAFDFLAGVEVDHTDETLFDGIVSVPAGSVWQVGMEGQIQRRRYHDWSLAREEIASPEHIRSLLSDAVRLRLRSDAPTVSLLSGGLDSSLITWLAATLGHKEPRSCFAGAFSYGYAGTQYAAHDELIQAEKLIAALPDPVPHHIHKADPVPRLDELLVLTAGQEQPFTTPSILASWRLYQQIHAQGIKVAISGEGADECFGGYTKRYLPLLARDLLYQGQWKQAFLLLRSPHLSASGVLKALSWHLPEITVRKMMRALRPNIAVLQESFWEQGDFCTIIGHHRENLHDQLCHGLTHDAMPQILRFSDRNAMAASVEVRLPFMDYRLVEYAQALPVSAKLSAKGGKQILREAFSGHVPGFVWQQPKTHGFGHAEQYQLHQMPWQALLARAPQESWDYIDRAALEVLLQQEDIHPMAWLPISFLLWMVVVHENAL